VSLGLHSTNNLVLGNSAVNPCDRLGELLAGRSDQEDTVRVARYLTGGNLTTEQANLTAKKQDVSKRIADLAREGNALVNVLDVTLRQHYGNRAEKLAEFGLQPFRSRPRIVRVGPDGKRLKPTKTNKEMPARRRPHNRPSLPGTKGRGFGHAPFFFS